MEVVERGEFLLGDDAGALECDALSALDGYLDALREESGVESGVVSLEFSGPLALAQSIASSIKGKFPLVKECKIKQV